MTRFSRAVGQEFFNPILYVPALGQRQRPSQHATRLARDQEFFSLDGIALVKFDLTDILSPPVDLLSNYSCRMPEKDLVVLVRSAVAEATTYEDRPSVRSTLRRAKEVAREKRGNCIESGLLLYAMLAHLGMSVTPVVSLNSQFHPTIEPSTHLFVRHTASDGKNSLFEGASLVEFPKSRLGYRRAAYSSRQFVSFLLGKSAERAMTWKGTIAPRKAERLLHLALEIDPAQYTHYLSLASIADHYEDERSVTFWCDKARELAPHYGDVAYFIGELLWPYDRRKAIAAYRHAFTTGLSAPFRFELYSRLHRHGEYRLKKQLFDL